MAKIISVFSATIFALAYSTTINTIPLFYLKNIDLYVLILGLILLSISIVYPPITYLEKLCIKLNLENTTLKTYFIGLFQFLLLQFIGWNLIKSVNCISFEILTNNSYLVDRGTIVETAGTVAVLVYTAFQTLVSTAENHFEIKGKIRLDRNNKLFAYLRITLSCIIGVFVSQDIGYRTTFPFIQFYLILSLISLIPFVAILYKTYRPKNLLDRSRTIIEIKSLSFFKNLKINNDDFEQDYKELKESLYFSSLIGAWNFKHKNYYLIRNNIEPFNTTLSRCIDYLKEVESSNPPNFHNANFFYKIETPLVFAEVLGTNNITSDDFKKFNNFHKLIPSTHDFKKSSDPIINLFHELFVPYKNLLICSMQGNGANYTHISDTIPLLGLQIQSIQSESWRKAIFLIMIGELTDGVLTLDPDHLVPNEVTHLWVLVSQLKMNLNLTANTDFNEITQYCQTQFAFAAENFKS